MKITNKELIEDLIKSTQELLVFSKEIRSLDQEILNYQSSPNSWSALQCLEHLNLYGDFYLPNIKEASVDARKVEETQVFKSGWLGNYFAKILAPKDKLNKMKTLDAMNPSASDLDISCVDRFIEQQNQFLELLSESKKLNLKTTKIRVSFSSVLRVRLGDTFRFLVSHNQRHIAQAKRALTIAKSNK